MWLISVIINLHLYRAVRRRHFLETSTSLPEIWRAQNHLTSSRGEEADAQYDVRGARRGAKLV